MKRLFKVVSAADSKAIPHGESAYYESKTKAKEVRNAMNSHKADGHPFKVSPGPDHHNYRE